MTTETFNFIFENTIFYQRDKMMNVFANVEQLQKYFDDFYMHYKKYENYFNPISKRRMNGKKIDNYTELHNYFNKLNDHYKLLLVTGENIFDTWLNNRIK